MKYSERMTSIRQLLLELQKCEDIEDAMQMYENALVHIKACEQKLSDAQGRFSELSNNGEATA